MGFISNLLNKIGIGRYSPVKSEGQSEDFVKYAHELENDFKIYRIKNAWKYEGGHIPIDASHSNIDDLMNVLASIQTKTTYSKICFLINKKRVAVILRTSPNPCCLLTKLSYKAIPEIVFLLQSIYPSCKKVVDFGNLYLVSLR